MTREEAIGHIKDVICENNTIKPNMVVFEQEKEALCIAIKALEQEPCEDAVSREAVLQGMYDLCNTGETLKENPWRDNPHIDAIIDTIENLPPVTPTPTECEDAVSREAVLRINELHHGQMPNHINHQIWEEVKTLSPVTPASRWIPITYRAMDDEEKKDFSERTGYDIECLDIMLDCLLPEDGETVLVTDRLGNVEVDTFINDCDGCYFEYNCDMQDIVAWMPLPEPWKGESE